MQYPYYFRTVSVLCPYNFRTISARESELFLFLKSVRFPGSARIVDSHTADLPSLLHQLHELGIAADDSVLHLLGCDPIEESARAFDLRLFDLPELH